MSYNYNTSNELTSNSAATFTYDSNGNTLTKSSSTGLTQYTWDFENRLSSVILPGTGGIVSFKYDAVGRRIQKSGLNGTVNYIYDGVNLIEEVDSFGNLLGRYAQGTGIDEPLGELRSGTNAFYEADGLGSITSLSSSAGTVSNSYTYDTFGNGAQGGSFVNPYRYTARDYDSEAGLQYSRARYYDPSIGRFISEDPFGLSGSDLNFYAYVHNSPTDSMDPFGLARCVYSVKDHVLACVPNAYKGEPPIVGEYGLGYVRVGPGGLHSGKADCQDQDRCVSTKDKGPIMPGNYKMNLDTRVERRPDGSIWDHAAGGQYRLEPWPHHSWDGFFYKRGWTRGGFELHVGSITFGCINADKTDPAVVGQYQNMRILLKTEDGKNFLSVVP
jgi:RHS repeat-associated protein